MDPTSAASRSEVPPSAWDRLCGPDDLYSTHRWLGIVERADGRPTRLLLAGGGGEAAGLAMVLADARTGRTSDRVDRMVAEAADPARVPEGWRRDPGSLLPVMVCGGRHNGRSRVLSAGRGADGPTGALVARAEREAAEAGAASVCFPYVDAADTALRRVLGRRGYTAFPVGPDHRLDVPPGGFEGYLAGLSRVRRKSVRAERRRIGRAGVGVRAGPLAEAPLEALAELERRGEEKYGRRRDPSRAAAHLAEVAEAFGDRALVLTAHAGGAVRGFSLLLGHRDRWYLRTSGFDYAFQRTLPLYFELYFYRPVELAAEHGAAAIVYELGADEAKRSRGCRAFPQYCHVLETRPRSGAGRGRGARRAPAAGEEPPWTQRRSTGASPPSPTGTTSST
ncbi:GNAT family N-acetyltransferase [Nocardiopsis sp. CNT-189]|uniref:GNAT family N-acetyltransferase n=1 Tax=Nocardiopsis oceanisediminis TaxID=2816862 RepID=UPI003B2AAA66